MSSRPASSAHAAAPTRSAGSGSAAGRRLTAWLLARLGRVLGPAPLRIELWNGIATSVSDEPPRATVRIRDWPTLARMVARPGAAFAEGYRRGDVEVHGDLVGALETVFEKRRSAGDRADTDAPSRSAVLRRARRRARAHYDLGNEFYRLWLDREMVYTCAYFPTADLDLEAAQVAKLDLVCRKLRLRPGDRVLETGCGWGALARHMAVRYGAQVTACNVSGEQLRWAQERAAEAGLGERVRFVEGDFREMRGTYDVFVSVGMLEHVGAEHYRDLGRVIDERLDPGHGRGLLHFIGRNRPQRLDPWIRRRIFPGAYPPTLDEVVREVLAPWDFSVLDVENLRLHYARTLAHWLARFEATADATARMFDEEFVRTWRLYLGSSQAAFTTGWLQLFQVSFARGTDNDVAWTRAELYGGNTRGTL